MKEYIFLIGKKALDLILSNYIVLIINLYPNQIIE